MVVFVCLVEGNGGQISPVSIRSVAIYSTHLHPAATCKSVLREEVIISETKQNYEIFLSVVQ